MNILLKYYLSKEIRELPEFKRFENISDARDFIFDINPMDWELFKLVDASS